MDKEQKYEAASDEMKKAGNEYNEKEYKYTAFISYRHVEPDQSIAKQVHQMIETFKAPKEFYQNGKRPAFRVFRDREELAARDLSTSIREALETSRYLIVICSKRTPLSEWCRKEIEIFKSLHGQERIIPVLIEGEPNEAFPVSLKGKESNNEEAAYEILAADLRPVKVLKADFKGYAYLQDNDRQSLKELTKESLSILKTEKYRIMAALLGCAFGDLKQRDKERKNRRILGISILSGTVFLIFGIFMANAYQKAELARKEAVQSNANILMKTSKEFLKEGDYLKGVLVAKEANGMLREDMKYYDSLKAEEEFILNSSIYHSGASTLTTISTKNNLTYMAVSDDEKYVAYGLENNDTAVASVQNGEVLEVFTGHTQQVKLVDFSKDNRYLASSSFDNTCIIYDLEKGEEKVKLEIEGVPMLTRFSEDGSKLFYAVNANNVLVFYTYDTTNWQKQGEFAISEPLKTVDISKDGSEILVVLCSNTEEQITIRNMADGKIVKVIPRINGKDPSQGEYEKPYIYAKYSSDGENLLLLTYSELIKFSLQNNKEVFKKEIMINDLGDLNLIMESDDGKNIILKANPRISVLDGKSGEISDEIYFPNIKMKYFTYNNKTNTIVGFGENGNYSIWRDKTIIESNLNYGGGVPTEFVFLKDGSKILANAHESQTIKIIELKSRVLSENVTARIMANSNDSSHMLLYDGNDLAVSDDDGRTVKKITVDEPSIYALLAASKLCQISNNGRYYAVMFKDYMSDVPHKTLKLYDLSNNKKKKIYINNTASLVYFSDDSKHIFVMDSAEGLSIYDVENLKQVKRYSEIKGDVLNMKLSNDSKILAVNMLSGTAFLYNLETNKQIDEISGEIINVENSGGEITAKGVKKNSIFKWNSNSGLITWDMDDECRQTPQSFDDVHFYNENADIVMIIRNNDIDRKCYVVDFSTGKLKFVLNVALRRYNANGHISPDGKLITIDKDYCEKSGKDSDHWSYEMMTSIYNVLSEGEVSKEVDGILAGRTLSQEEKVRIGITAK
ncbi:WD domain, G-beta repeat protein [Catonella morbi ATCC 51271]|uniref:WD domain, G-beta repeat protein n=1 Tax=Catonella morbi ATCC 51271 TaxID=592026 RepID=V2Y5X5_9FIRM|nr:TIR domain-containing protein [Catonella morbi]ESL04348.1 WD domain, G-beta repeat protein [Catonella morbi ATCC 51271]